MLLYNAVKGLYSFVFSQNGRRVYSPAIFFALYMTGLIIE